MEIRKIVIVSSGGQRKQVIETGAETLAQLKEDLRRNNIDFEDMTFFEGLSKTELTHDESLLPRDIPRNGSTTNNLVFMLTTPQKKIKSGVSSRTEIYTIIKTKGLQDACLKKYGKNFTMCKTVELEELLKGEEKPEANTADCEKVNKEDSPERKAIRELVKVLYETDLLEACECDRVLSHIKDSAPEDMTGDCPYTDAELDKILEGHF